MRPVFFSLLAVVALQALPIGKVLTDPLRYDTQRRIYEAQQRQAQDSSAETYTPLAQHPLKKADRNATCVTLKQIDTSAIRLIDRQKLQAIVAPHLNHCNTMADIQNLIRSINNLYIEKAYITSMAYLKPQDIASGKLVISAVEGKIEDVEGKGVKPDLVFWGAKDKPLNLRELETGIEQLNRLESKTVTMALEPGSKTGYSRVLLEGRQNGFPLHGSLGVNNYGTEASGRVQFSGTLYWEDPLGWNDILTLNLNTTDRQESDNRSLGSSIGYAIPVGRAYLQLRYYRFDYTQIVNGLNKDYLSEGESRNVMLRIDYKLFHGANSRGECFMALERKRNDNYLAGVYLENSSSVLSVLQAGYTHTVSGKTWHGYATLTYHRGVPWFDATGGAFAEPTFDKATLSILFSQEWFTGTDHPVSYTFSFYGQLAPEDIIATEQIGIGGPYSVRGFRNEEQLSGNNGFYLRNEWSVTYPVSSFFFSPFVSFDYGVVEENDYSYGGRIAGLGIGFRLQEKQWMLSLSASKSVADSNHIAYRPNGDMVVKDDKPFLGFELTYRF